MIPLIFLLVTTPPQTGQPVEQISLPGNPEHGLHVDSAGRFYMARIDDDGVRAVRYARTDTGLKEEFVYPQKFSGPLEFLTTKDGIVTVDYETGIARSLDENGKQLWKADAGLPGVARLDAAGNVWFTARGSIWQKTPDSSEVEPLLSQHGAEIRTPLLMDIAPLDGGVFYALGDDGRVLLYNRSGRPRTVASGFINGVRIFRTGLGGVLVLEHAPNETSLKHVSENGSIALLWRGGSELGNLKSAGRIGDGRLVLGSQADTGGKAFIIDAEGGR